MKRLLSLLTACLLFLGLCSCSPATYSVEKDGVTYTVDKSAGVISDGEHSYRFSSRKTGNHGFRVEITYPDGSSYWRDWISDTMVVGAGSPDYDSEKYTPGEVLSAIIREDHPIETWSIRIGAFIILFSWGLFIFLKPRIIWELSHSWIFKGTAEPSDMALFYTRLEGIVVIALSLLVLFLL